MTEGEREKGLGGRLTDVRRVADGDAIEAKLSALLTEVDALKSAYAYTNDETVMRSVRDKLYYARLDVRIWRDDIRRRLPESEDEERNE